MHRLERDRGRRERFRGRALSQRGLLIHVQDGETTKTHVQIPLGLAAAAGKFLPKKARDYFEQYGIDVSDLLDSVAKDTDRRGELVNIEDGETRVQIAIT